MAISKEPQLGHTYQTIEGGTVRIIGKKFSFYPYQGNNGRWYDEQGRENWSRDQPTDLFSDLTNPCGNIFGAPLYSPAPPPVTVNLDIAHSVAQLVASIAVEAFRLFRR